MDNEQKTPIIPSVSSENQFHTSHGWNFDTKEYLKFLLSLMVDYNASDIYLTHGEAPVLRIYGDAMRIEWLSALDDNTLNQFKWFLVKSEEDKALFEEHFSVDLWISLHSRRYRINFSKQRGHIMIVARLLSEKVPTIDELWLPQIFKTLMDRTSWLIFVTWPTWSGKSTTLAAMIEEINQNKYRHIITVEDPIEYVFAPQKSIFEQKQLGRDITSFASAMKYALRQRPDIILFGEARDPESLKNAMALAETWHLVITTIHSRSVEQAINKIISMFPQDEQDQIRNNLAENMVAIIVQRLLKKKDENGMIPAHEIALNNTALENAIRENKLNQVDNVIFTNRWAGMQLMDDDLVRLVIEDKIDINTAIENARDRVHLKDGLKDAGINI